LKRKKLSWQIEIILGRSVGGPKKLVNEINLKGSFHQYHLFLLSDSVWEGVDGKEIVISKGYQDK